MKVYKVIAFCVAQLLCVWVSAAVLVATYVPMSALAYAERGYKAIGGEIIPVVLVAIAVWHGMGWLMKVWYRDMIGGGHNDRP